MNNEKVRELTQAQRDEIETLDNNSLPDDVYIGYLDEMGTDDLSDFDEAYSGQFDSDEDFARDMAENLGETTSTHWPHYCIDWEYAAHELMMDYTEIEGHYFRNM